MSIILLASINPSGETTTTKAFAEDLKNFCQEKVHRQDEGSHIRMKVRRNAVWQDVKPKCARLNVKDLNANNFVKVSITLWQFWLILAILSMLR